jgi:hypothetical protein
MGKGGKVAGMVLLIALVVLAVGCGGDASTGGAADETDGEPERLYPSVRGPGREFLIPDGDNLVQTFGDEASAGELAKASRVVQAWMKARVAKDWAEDCKYFSRSYSSALVKDAHGVTNGRVKSCPGALNYFGPNASGTSGNTLTGSIDSLRVRGPRAYAQWHGPEEDWVLPMRIEDGVWKVESASPLERTK